MKRITRIFALLLGMCLTAGMLISCWKDSEKNKVPATTAPLYLEAEPGMSPSRVYEVLCKSKNVGLGVSSKNPEFNGYGRTMGKTDTAIQIRTNYGKIVMDRPVSYSGQGYFDLKERKMYDREVMCWRVYDIDPSVTWTTVLDEFFASMEWMFPEEDPLYLFRDEIYELQDGTYVARKDALPKGIRELKMSNKDIVYEFDAVVNGSNGQYQVEFSIEFGVELNIKFPEDAIPPDEPAKQRVHPKLLSQLIPGNLKEVKPHQLPTTPPDDQTKQMSPSEFFYALQTDEHLRIELEYVDDVYSCSKIMIYRDGEKLCVELYGSEELPIDTWYIDMKNSVKHCQSTNGWTSALMETDFSWDIMITLLNELMNKPISFRDANYSTIGDGSYSLYSYYGEKKGIKRAGFANYKEQYIYSSVMEDDCNAKISVWFDYDESIVFPSASA